jgi:hypothetical protein
MTGADASTALNTSVHGYSTFISIPLERLFALRRRFPKVLF